jgi:hypothetical protein
MEEGGGEGRGFIVRDYVDRQQILKSPLYSDSKVLFIVTLHSKYSRALTFENVVLCRESVLHLGASAVSMCI